MIYPTSCQEVDYVPLTLEIREIRIRSSYKKKFTGVEISPACGSLDEQATVSKPDHLGVR